jgi:hypothetical protein
MRTKDHCNREERRRIKTFQYNNKQLPGHHDAGKSLSVVWAYVNSQRLGKWAEFDMILGIMKRPLLQTFVRPVCLSTYRDISRQNLRELLTKNVASILFLSKSIKGISEAKCRRVMKITSYFPGAVGRYPS